MNNTTFIVRAAHWPEEMAALRLVRNRVFVEEQKVPVALEWDDKDTHALHLIALDHANRPIGTVRLLRTGQIGRMAVLPEWRGKGVGKALLSKLLAETRRDNDIALYLNAQLQVVKFYAQFGFIARGELFREAGILHQRMEISTDD